VHQPEDVERRTLATLKDSPFNKLRMCVLPTSYKDKADEPTWFPFVRNSDGKFDLSRFDVGFFRHLEQRIAQLDRMGIEADVILFHPYDKGMMGFDQMSAETDDRYVRYVVARLAAYRNVWWSMANEFDLMKQKTDADFDRMFQIVRDEDPSDHLRSIHFSNHMYDNARPWVTHQSIQNGAALDDLGRASIYRDVVQKPVIFDEARYEGHIESRWGQETAESMIEHFWIGTIGGTYVGHGEVLGAGPTSAPAAKDGRAVIWTGRGGELRGQSAARIGFLKSILEAGPAEGIEPLDRFYQWHVAGRGGEYYLVYFGAERPTQWTFELPRDRLKAGMTFSVDVLDTWNMTTTPVDGPPFKLVKHGTYAFGAEGDRTIALPGKPWIAIRIRPVGDAKEATTGTSAPPAGNE
jgi:hypothetical protein